MLGYSPVVVEPGASAETALTAALYGESYERSCRSFESQPEEILLHIYGGHMSMRRAACLHVGVFSEQFRERYHPDREFGIRCLKAGLVGRFDRSLVAFHHYARSLSDFRADARSGGAATAVIHRLHSDVLGPIEPGVSARGAPLPARWVIRLSRFERFTAGGVGVGRGTRSTARTDARAYAPTDGLEAPDADGASEGPVRVVRMRKPSCSVVVCTRHRPALLARCLASLARLEHRSYEVIVVDNTRRTRGRAVAAEAGARYVVESRVGLSRARNTGRPGAEGAIVAYIDDDAVAEPDWLTRHAAAFDDPGLLGTTGRFCRLLSTRLQPRYAAAGGEDLGDLVSRRSFDSRVVRDGELRRRRRRSEHGVQAHALRAGGGFRESLGSARESSARESYAFFTIIRAGHAIAYLPDAVVRHDYPTTMPALRQSASRILRGSAAYMLMLLVEEPEFRRNTIRYMWGAARGTPRPWRRGDTLERLANRRAAPGRRRCRCAALRTLGAGPRRLQRADSPGPASRAEPQRPSVPK